ncbi:hypothetical protein J6590_042136 [Homalodisca vitripennis]|nr:hypothetical protein J6590_042136 [Homalodisca vitripennis]
MFHKLSLNERALPWLSYWRMPLGNTDTDLANRCGAAASFSMSSTLLSMPLPPPLPVRYGTPETSVVQNCTALWSPVVTELDTYLSC